MQGRHGAQDAGSAMLFLAWSLRELLTVWVAQFALFILSA